MSEADTVKTPSKADPELRRAIEAIKAALAALEARIEALE